MEYRVIRKDDELYHHGVKGMKWGVRRYQNADGSLTDKGIKKYAKKGYAQDSYNSNKTKLGKAYDKVTNAHKYAGDMKYSMSSKKANKARAEKYVADEQAKQNNKQNLEPKKKGLSNRQKTALKVGAAAAGTALAAYGAYKLHNFVREKNQDIRLNEGKAKCDSMLKKLDRMRINDYVNGSSGTEKWTNPRSYKRHGFQYNNNGKSVTLAREYRNPVSTLKPTQYMNIERKVIDKTIRDAFDKAKNDSFATAAKNVSKHYLEEAKRRVRER